MKSTRAWSFSSQRVQKYTDTQTRMMHFCTHRHWSQLYRRLPSGSKLVPHCLCKLVPHWQCGTLAVWHTVGASWFHTHTWRHPVAALPWRQWGPDHLEANTSSVLVGEQAKTWSVSNIFFFFLHLLASPSARSDGSLALWVVNYYPPAIEKLTSVTVFRFKTCSIVQTFDWNTLTLNPLKEKPRLGKDGRPLLNKPKLELCKKR